jgi:hypothetical protein
MSVTAKKMLQLGKSVTQRNGQQLRNSQSTRGQQAGPHGTKASQGHGLDVNAAVAGVSAAQDADEAVPGQPEKRTVRSGAGTAVDLDMPMFREPASGAAAPAGVDTLSLGQMYNCSGRILTTSGFRLGSMRCAWQSGGRSRMWISNAHLGWSKRQTIRKRNGAQRICFGVAAAVTHKSLRALHAKQEHRLAEQVPCMRRSELCNIA